MWRNNLAKAKLGNEWYFPNGTNISNDSLYSYTDWKAGFTKDFGGGLSGSIAYVGTNAKQAGYYSPQNKNLGKSGGLISLTKTF